MSRYHTVRQNVHEDRFSAEGVADFARNNGRNIAIGTAAVLAVLAGVFFFQSSSSGNERAAALALLQARTDFEQNQMDPAATKLSQLISSYGGTTAGTRARLLLGDIELARSNPAAAETHFKGFLAKHNSSDYIWSNGQRGLAVSLENQSKFKEAAEAYAALLKAPLGDEEKAHALLDAARAHKLGGDTTAAQAAWDRIAKEFSTTRAAIQARIHLAEMGAGAAR